MTTSITNKIIVIFLTLVTFISFAILILNIHYLAKYGERIDTTEIIYILIIICLLLIITSFILGRYLVNRVSHPLESLIKQVVDMKITDGSANNEIIANDEIEYLTKSFHNMKTELFT